MNCESAKSSLLCTNLALVQLVITGYNDVFGLCAFGGWIEGSIECMFYFLNGLTIAVGCNGMQSYLYGMQSYLYGIAQC